MARKKRKLTTLGKLRQVNKNYRDLLEAYTVRVNERNRLQGHSNLLMYAGRKLRMAIVNAPALAENYDISQLMAFINAASPEENTP